MCHMHEGMVDSYCLGITKNVSWVTFLHIRLAQSTTTRNFALIFTRTFIDLFITYSYIWYGCFHCVFDWLYLIVFTGNMAGKKMENTKSEDLPKKNM